VSYAQVFLYFIVFGLGCLNNGQYISFNLAQALYRVVAFEWFVKCQFIFIEIGLGSPIQRS
jgi:hypothetical protein